MDVGQVESDLLGRLYRDHCWGAKHRCESNLLKNFPRHLRGAVKKAAERLRREGLLVKKPSSHEHQWFLNIAMRQEIEQRMRRGIRSYLLP